MYFFKPFVLSLLHPSYPSSRQFTKERKGKQLHPFSSPGYLLSPAFYALHYVLLSVIEGYAFRALNKMCKTFQVEIYLSYIIQSFLLIYVSFSHVYMAKTCV